MRDDGRAAYQDMVLLTREGAALRDRLAARFGEPAPWMLVLSARDQRQLRDILRQGLAFEQSAGASAESRPGWGASTPSSRPRGPTVPHQAWRQGPTPLPPGTGDVIR